MALEDEERYRNLDIRLPGEETPRAPVSAENADRYSNLDIQVPALNTREKQERRQAKAEALPEATFGQKVKHAAKGAGQAAFDVLEMPYNLEKLANQGVQALGFDGFQTSERSLPEAVVDTIGGEGTYQGFRQALAGEELAREQAPVADSIRTALEWGAAGPYNFVRKGFVKALPDIGAAAGAVGGQVLGGDVGEVAGGFVGALAGARKGKAPKGEETAYDFVMKHAENPEEAVAKLKIALERGDKGTLADLTGDIGIYDIEAAAATNPSIGRKVKKAEEAMQAQIRERIGEPFGGGDAAASAEVARDRTYSRGRTIDEVENTRIERLDAETAARTQALDNQVAQADEAATAAGRQVQTGQTTADTSRAFQDKIITDARTHKKQVVDPLYAKFEAEAAVDPRAIVDSAKEHIRGLKDVEREILGSNSALVAKPNKWLKADKPPSGTAVSDWFSRMRMRIEDLKSRNNGNMTNEARVLNNYMKDVEAAFAEANPAFREASEAYAEYSNLYRRGPLSEVDKARDVPELAAEKIGFKGNRGAAAMRQFKATGDTEYIPMTVEHLKALAKERGGVDAGFLRDHQQVLRELPADARAQFENAVRTSDAADATRKVVGEQKTALSQARRQQEQAVKETAGKQRGLAGSRVTKRYGEDPAGTLDSLLAKPGNVQNEKDLKRLVKYMDDTGNGESIRGALRDRLQERLGTALNGKAEVRQRAIGDFEKMRDTLVNSGAITQQQAFELTDEIGRVRTAAERQTAVARYMERGGNEWDNLVASGLAASVMAASPFSQSLILAGAVRRYFKRALKVGNYEADEVRALERMMLEPEAFLQGMENVKTAEELATSMLTKAIGRGQAVEIMASAVEEEDE